MSREGGQSLLLCPLTSRPPPTALPANGTRQDARFQVELTGRNAFWGLDRSGPFVSKG